MLSDLQEPQAFAPSAASATVGLVLLLASVALFPAGRALALRLFPGRNVVFARWGFSHVGLAMLFYFSTLIVAGWALGAAGVDLSRGVGPLVFSAALQLATVLLIASFARRLDPDGVRSLGLRAGRWGAAALVGAVGYALALPALAGSLLISAWLWRALGVDAPAQDLLKLVLALEGAERAVFVVLAVAVVPLFEELIFRAFLQPLLVQNLGDRGGVAATAALFAAVHANLFAFLPIFTLALLLGLVMLRTQRLVAAWTVHALHNGLMLALLLTSEWARALSNP